MKKIIKIILPNFIIVNIKKLFDKINEFRQRRILKKINGNFVNVSHINNNNILSELCEKYGSDKGFISYNSKKPYNWKPHSYTSFYHSIFSLNRESVKFVYECGIGTNNLNIKSNMTENAEPGASLRVWRDYFINANIFGGDIDKNVLFEEDRIKTYFVDQLNESSIKMMWEKTGVEKFDIIIDDGLHEPKANLNFFFNSIHKLKKNGIYIIEDVSNYHIKYLNNELNKYDVETVILSTNYKKFYDNNNLIVIRKLKAF